MDDRPILLDPLNRAVASATTIAAIGLADDLPALAEIRNAGLSLRPLLPVHPRLTVSADGSWRLTWSRRERGAWNWQETGEIPLNEAREEYVVGVGDPDAPELSWQTFGAALDLPHEIAINLQISHSGKSLWVRRIGTRSNSAPLILHRIK